MERRRRTRGSAGSLVLLVCASTFLGCGGGGADSGGGNGNGTGNDPGAGVTVTGKARYEFPPPAANCNGLDFDAIQLLPIRQATIQLIDAATNAVLDETLSDDNGDFALTVDADTNAFLRIRSQLKRSGNPSWDVEVRDNTSRTNLALDARPLYVLDGSAFDTGTADVARDVTATTGWGGSAYTAVRAAAPFAILDAIYEAMLLVSSEQPEVQFELLDVFWSVNNTATGGERNLDAGEIGTSFYRSDNKLFLLGADGVDTEEFDDHVIVHEWGHFYEDTLSRSDSIGGAHGIGDLLDMRVAFGEGFATAYSGMALESPDYCDTLWFGETLRGFGIDIEAQPGGTAGWFNEISVMKFLYDLWDSDADGLDTASLGFGPIHRIMTAAQAETPAFTSIFSFAAALRAENPEEAAFIDDLLEAENIMGVGIDAFGEGELNDGQAGTPEDVLPLYTALVPDGSVMEICSNSEFDRSGATLTADGNKLAEHRFLRMTVDIAGPYTFEIITTTEMPTEDDPEDDRDQSDPDILVLRNGEVQNEVVGGDLQGFSGDANEEVFTTPNALAAGDYVMALTEFRYHDEESPADYPARTCFDVSVSPAL